MSAKIVRVPNLHLCACIVRLGKHDTILGYLNGSHL